MKYAVRVSFQDGDYDSLLNIDWFIVTVPKDCDDVIEYIQSFLKNVCKIEYGVVTLYSFVDGFYLKGGE